MEVATETDPLSWVTASPTIILTFCTQCSRLRTTALVFHLREFACQSELLSGFSAMQRPPPESWGGGGFRPCGQLEGFPCQRNFGNHQTRACRVDPGISRTLGQSTAAANALFRRLYPQLPIWRREKPMRRVQYSSIAKNCPQSLKDAKKLLPRRYGERGITRAANTTRTKRRSRQRLKGNKTFV